MAEFYKGIPTKSKYPARKKKLADVRATMYVAIVILALYRYLKLSVMSLS